jgi:hypothetical protein
MTISPNTIMKITLTQTEESENDWETIEEVDEFEMTWGELQTARPGDENYYLLRWIMGPLMND